ncbi:MAG: LysR family transcriptional regulator [Lachnospiraceae bacterium]|nr:LysR family transcriptional regulator [Lachnospiraceae bacterium]
MLVGKSFQYVKAIRQEGSFSRAAESLGISQPSLSQYIIKLEKQLGASLFERGGGEVKLTEAGKLYWETALRMEELQQELQLKLEDLAADYKGSLTVGTAPYRSAFMMPRIVKRFHEKYPEIRVIIREGTTRELMEGLEQGIFDLCLSVLDREAERFAYEKVMEEELLLAMPREGAIPEAQTAEGRRYPAVPVSRLEGMSFVTLTQSQIMQQSLEKLCGDNGIVFHTAAVVKSLEAQIAMVKAGVGAALVPEGVRVFCHPGEVCFYSILEPKLSRDVAVIWRGERRLSRRGEAFKEVIREIQW